MTSWMPRHSNFWKEGQTSERTEKLPKHSWGPPGQILHRSDVATGSEWRRGMFKIAQQLNHSNRIEPSSPDSLVLLFYADST